MFIIFYLPFLILIILTSYYLIYQNQLNNELLFYLLINFIFLITTPLYYYFLKSITYTLITSLSLNIFSFILNLKIKSKFNKTLLAFIIYFISTLIISYYLIFTL